MGRFARDRLFRRNTLSMTRTPPEVRRVSAAQESGEWISRKDQPVFVLSAGGVIEPGWKIAKETKDEVVVVKRAGKKVLDTRRFTAQDKNLTEFDRLNSGLTKQALDYLFVDREIADDKTDVAPTPEAFQAARLARIKPVDEVIAAVARNDHRIVAEYFTRSVLAQARELNLHASNLAELADRIVEKQAEITEKLSKLHEETEEKSRTLAKLQMARRPDADKIAELEAAVQQLQLRQKAYRGLERQYLPRLIKLYEVADAYDAQAQQP